MNDSLHDQLNVFIPLKEELTLFLGTNTFIDFEVNLLPYGPNFKMNVEITFRQSRRRRRTDADSL